MFSSPTSVLGLQTLWSEGKALKCPKITSHIVGVTANTHNNSSNNNCINNYIVCCCCYSFSHSSTLDICGLQAASEPQEIFLGDAEYEELRKQLYTITYAYVANMIIYYCTVT